jgi:hypothetical protein
MQTMENNPVHVTDPRRHLARRLAVTAVAVLGVAVAATLAGGGPDPVVEVVQPPAEQPLPPASVPIPTSAASPEPSPTTQAPPTTQATQTTQPQAPAERLTQASRMTLDGIGPVKVGMTLAEASAAAGAPLEVMPSPTEGCAHARPAGGPEHVMFMVVDGKVVRVEAGPGITTLSGIGVGSTEAEVLATYPGQIRVEPNPYQGHRGFHTLVYTPADPAFAQYGLIFETNGERVTSFRSGFAGPVAWIEGCL